MGGTDKAQEFSRVEQTPRRLRAFAMQMLNSGRFSVHEVADCFEVTFQTVYRWKREILIGPRHRGVIITRAWKEKS